MTALAVTPHAAERRALLPVLQRAPADVALPVLMAFLDDGDLGIEHAAAAAMARSSVASCACSRAKRAA